MSSSIHFQEGERLRINVIGSEGQRFDSFLYTLPYAMDLEDVALRYAQTLQPGMIVEIVSGRNKWAFRKSSIGGATSIEPVRSTPPRRMPKKGTTMAYDNDDDNDDDNGDERDQRWVDFYDADVIGLMHSWYGGQDDPLYAIASSDGNYAWVFEDAISNLDRDIRRVKKIGRNKYQLGKGTFTEAEIDELHQIRDALASALEEGAGRSLEARRRSARAVSSKRSPQGASTRRIFERPKRSAHRPLKARGNTRRS